MLKKGQENMFAIVISSLVIFAILFGLVYFVQFEYLRTGTTKQIIKEEKESNGALVLMAFLRSKVTYDIDNDGKDENVTVATLLNSRDDNAKAIIKERSERFFEPVYEDEWQLIAAYQNNNQLYGHILFSDFNKVSQVIPGLNNEVINIEFNYRD